MMNSLSQRGNAVQKKPRANLFFIITVLYWFGGYSYTPTFSPYLRSIGIGYAMIGIIGGAYGLSQLLLRVPLGLWSDRIGKRKIFVVCGVLFGAISTFFMFFTTNPYIILVLRFMGGMAASAWVIFTVLFSSYFDKGQAASRISYLQMANTLGIMSARLLGSFVDNVFGYKASFILGGVASVIALVLSLFLTESVPEVKERPAIRDLIGVVRDKNLLTMSILAIFSQMLLFATTNTFTSEAASQLGADSAQLGLITTLASIPPIFCAGICGKLFAKKVNLRLLIAACFVVETIGTLMIAGASNVIVIYIASILMGFGFGTCIATTLSYCTLTVDEDKRSMAMGIFQASYSIGLFAGPVLLGAFADGFGISAAFIAASGMSIIGLILALVLLKNKRA